MLRLSSVPATSLPSATTPAPHADSASAPAMRPIRAFMTTPERARQLARPIPGKQPGAPHFLEWRRGTHQFKTVSVLAATASHACPDARGLRGRLLRELRRLARA